MANNRYYLYCPYCHGHRWLGKSLGDWTACDHDTDYCEGIELVVYNYDTVSIQDVLHFIGVHISCAPGQDLASSEWYDGTFVEIISEYDARLKLQNEESRIVQFEKDKVPNEDSH